MSIQLLKGTGDNAYLYQETTGSAAIGIDATDGDKLKIVVSAASGAIITDTPQLTIDPAANGNVSVDPNGTGELQLVSGNFDFPETTASTNGVISQDGVPLMHTYRDPNGTYDSLFVGQGAGNFTAAGSDNDSRNTGIGSGCLKALTSGVHNTFLGHVAGRYLTSGSQNTGIGMDVIGKISGDGGTPTTGSRNTALGFQALATLTSGDKNTAVGSNSAWRLTTGGHNVAIGAGDQDGGASDGTLFNLTTGSFNIAIGASTGVTNTGAGNQYTGAESSNIVIGPMTVGVTGESNTMRLGTTGSGDGQVNRCFIAGIVGVTTGMNDAIPVLIDSAGQLGTVSSSARYKENIKPMGDASSPLLNLKPAVFNYKSDAAKSVRYGLIAEEVQEVMPNLVVLDEEGRPETVKYQDLSVLLLNELIKIKEELKEAKERIYSLEALQ